MSDVTQLLNQIEAGDPKAAEKLLPLVYEELRKLAESRLRNERPGQTFQSTDLVHEAYLRMTTPSQTQGWDGRSHFFAAAAEAMRRILVDRARKKHRVRHGGKLQRVELDEDRSSVEFDALKILVIDEALTELEKLDATASSILRTREVIAHS